MKKPILLSLLCCALVFGKSSKNNTSDDEMLFNKAIEFSKKFIIVDTHVDLPYRLWRHSEDITNLTKDGHFDYERAMKGGLNAPFMSIYIPAEYQKTGGCYGLADSLIDLVDSLAENFPNKFAIAVSTNDVKNQFGKGIISFPMGMENGCPINSIKDLKHFYERGIRYITLTHSKANHICDSSYDPNKKWNGLSPFGKSLIPEMNKLGIMVDISHVSDSTFYQTLKISKVPLIASHSSCRYFTHGFERNMNDDMIKKLAEKGGVIQITFGSYFIMGGFNKISTDIENYLTDHNLKRSSDEGKKFVEEYLKNHPRNPGTVADVAEHIDHVVKLAGIDHVGLGSDFEGVGTLPKNLEDVSCYPNLIYELLKKGYSENDIQKICSGNILRVWKEVEEFAAKQ